MHAPGGRLVGRGVGQGGAGAWSIPAVSRFLRPTSAGAWVLPRLEDRCQPPFLDELDTRNLGV